MKTDTANIDTIAAHLRQTEPLITDGDFTAAVLTRLPHFGELQDWKKNALLLTATALGSAIVASQVPVTLIPDFLDAAAANWLGLLGTATMLTYGTAIAAIWVISRR